jgi:hypothetical protein
MYIYRFFVPYFVKFKLSFAIPSLAQKIATIQSQQLQNQNAVWQGRTLVSPITARNDLECGNKNQIL